jgi:hypothetical protein
LQNASYCPINPKPLLLLAYLALEGPTSRRILAELFFGDVKDPRDSLSTALKHLREHLPKEVSIGPEMASTSVLCDAKELLRLLDEGQLEEAVSLYRGPFLQNLSLPLTEELERWVYEKQDGIAQRLRIALLEQAESVAEEDKVKAARLAERVWRLTKDQGIDAETFARLYTLLLEGSSPYAMEIRRQAINYGIPLITLARTISSQPEIPSRGEKRMPPMRAYVRELFARLEVLQDEEAGLALGVWGPPGIGKTYTGRYLALRGKNPQAWRMWRMRLPRS